VQGGFLVVILNDIVPWRSARITERHEGQGHDNSNFGLQHLYSA
jgi:hypothetical protein